MNEQKEFSRDGTRIYRYSEKDLQKREVVVPYYGDAEIIVNHIEKHIGKVEFVLHEIVSETVHIDVHVVKPTEERNFYTLVTSGMSQNPMKTPEGVEGMQYSELMISLPTDWKLSEESFKYERYYWPIRQLKYLARFPHDLNTWISYGHTIPNMDPPKSFAENTEMCGILLMPPILTPDGFCIQSVNNEKTIHYFALIPLYHEEIDFKLAKGLDTLTDKFDKYKVSELLNIGRRNTCGSMIKMLFD